MLLVTPSAPHRAPSPSRGERRLQQDSLNGALFLLRQEVRHVGGFLGGLCAAALQGLALGGLPSVGPGLQWMLLLPELFLSPKSEGMRQILGCSPGRDNTGSMFVAWVLLSHALLTGKSSGQQKCFLFSPQAPKTFAVHALHLFEMKFSFP